MRKDIGGWQVRFDAQQRERYVAQGIWLDRTVADAALALEEREPDRVTHVAQGREHRVGELVEQARALAAGLAQRGLKAGDVVSFQLPNWTEAIAVDLACAMLGLVVNPIVPIYRDAEVALTLADCRAKAVFVPESFRGFDHAAMMRRLAPQLPELRMVCTVRAAQPDGDSFEALVGSGARLPALPRVDPDAVKMVMYTSGTTGRPKGVLHSHNTLPRAILESARHWGIREGETFLMASPVTHVTGYSCGIEMPFLCRTRSVLMDRWQAAEAVELIDREQINATVSATPFLHELVMEAQRLGRRLPSLRVFACGGAAVPPELIRQADAALENCRAFRVYGSSEAPFTTLGFLGSGQEDLAAETDGEIIDFEVIVADEHGRELPRGAEGEICARGPALFLGYADAAQTAESFDDRGYFRTGDMGYVTPQRAVVITGRKKDLINRGGEKISAKEVEDLVHTHPAVQEAAVVSMPHARLGETVCAYVIPRPGAEVSLADLLKVAEAAGVAKQKYPEQLVVVSELPRTASGKIRKDLLREDIRERLRVERG
ncbi:MAG TPA: AMP-binding protein [Quisquiliibacterium sp.]|nr:AMP-binding protein [Quisquiliibacterium sp.]